MRTTSVGPYSQRESWGKNSSSIKTLLKSCNEEALKSFLWAPYTRPTHALSLLLGHVVSHLHVWRHTSPPPILLTRDLPCLFYRQLARPQLLSSWIWTLPLSNLLLTCTSSGYLPSNWRSLSLTKPPRWIEPPYPSTYMSFNLPNMHNLVHQEPHRGWANHGYRKHRHHLHVLHVMLLRSEKT